MIIAEHGAAARGNVRKPSSGSPNANPWAMLASMSPESPPGDARLADLRTGLAGARGFRDFSCLPPAEENRPQPVDPAQPHTNSLKIIEVFHVDRFRKTSRDATRSQLTHQQYIRHPEVVCPHRLTPERLTASNL